MSRFQNPMSMPLKIILFLVATSLCSQTAPAWDDTGHQIVAAIAWSQLEKPVQEKITLLFPSDPKSKGHIIFTASKRQPTDDDPFPHTVYNHVTIANWMDDLRDNSYDKPLADWHFVDRPFFDGIQPKLAVPKSPNAREKIIEMISTLQKVRHFDKADRDHRDDKTKAAYALAALIHLIGDVHQPLHCASRFSPGFEEGDGGGNAFKIGPRDADKLHTYWDAAGGLFDFAKLGRDFDLTQQQQLTDFVSRVLSRWDPEKHTEWRNFNPEEWVEESFQIAKQEVYTGIKPLEKPDQAYEKKTQQIAAERIATAGYRLAAVLNQIFTEP
jgi:hypothetical protein